MPDLEVHRLASLITYEAAGCSSTVWLTIAFVYGQRRNTNWSGGRLPLLPWESIPFEIRQVALGWGEMTEPFPGAHYVMQFGASLHNAEARRLTWSRGPPLWIEACRGGVVAVYGRGGA